MKRFITYLFEYVNENKGKNIGFIRTDIRSGTCKMEVHVHNLNRFQGKGQILLLVDQGEPVGIPVGNMVISQGRGDGTCAFPANPVAETKYPFASIAGVGVWFGNQSYAASCWKDDIRPEFKKGKFRLWGEKAVESEQEEVQSREETQSVAEERSQAVTQSEEENQDSETLRSVEKVQNSVEERTAEENKRSEEMKSTMTATASGEVRTSEEIREAAAVEQEESRKNEGHVQEVSEQMLQHAAGEEDDFRLPSTQVKLTKIDINSIRQLPKKNWYLCNNSFVIHGYFNYHYLMLKEVQENGVKKCYLGVPGIYERPERMMALLFGFPEFEPAPGADQTSDWRIAPGETSECGRTFPSDQTSAPESRPQSETPEGAFGYWLCLLDT